MFVFPLEREHLLLMDDVSPGPYSFQHKSTWLNDELFVSLSNRPILIILGGHSSHAKSSWCRLSCTWKERDTTVLSIPYYAPRTILGCVSNVASQLLWRIIYSCFVYAKSLQLFLNNRYSLLTRIFFQCLFLLKWVKFFLQKKNDTLQNPPVEKPKKCQTTHVERDKYFELKKMSHLRFQSLRAELCSLTRSVW